MFYQVHNIRLRQLRRRNNSLDALEDRTDVIAIKLQQSIDAISSHSEYTQTLIKTVADTAKDERVQLSDVFIILNSDLNAYVTKVACELRETALVVVNKGSQNTSTLNTQSHSDKCMSRQI